MLRAIRSRMTYANVVATIALFVALGGASYAAVTLPKNSVGAPQIKKNAVTGAKVRNSSLTGSDVKDGSLTTKDFRGAVQGPTGPQGPKGDPGTGGRADTAASADDAAKLGGLAPSAFQAAGHVLFGRAPYEPDDTARSVVLVPGFFELFTTADNDTQFDLAIASRNGGSIHVASSNPASDNLTTTSTTPTAAFDVLLATSGRILTFTINDDTRQATVTCGFPTGGSTPPVVCSALVN